MNISSSFKELARFEDQAEKCLRCGLCLHYCPVYREEHDESLVARGRNRLITELTDKDQDFTRDFSDQLSVCLLCNRCSMFCPAGIRSDQLLLALRADVVRERGIAFPKNAVYRWLLPDIHRFALATKLASRFQWILPKYRGDAKRLPRLLSFLGKGRYVPHIASRTLIEMVPEVVSPPPGTAVRMRVGLFAGCLFMLVWPHIGKSMINTLAKNGVEVVIPRMQGCCGMPVLGVGDFDMARTIADSVVTTYKDLDFVVTGCATCGSALRHYQSYLADTDERAKSYGKFTPRVRDLTELLVDELKLPVSAYEKPVGQSLKVTYHDPCHMARYQNLVRQPRKILNSINGLELVEMDGADDCCGMGGAFTVYHYQVSQKIADHKIESIRKTNADIVVTTCPGCMIQIRDGLLRHNMHQKVLHIAQLLDGENNEL